MNYKTEDENEVVGIYYTLFHRNVGAPAGDGPLPAYRVSLCGILKVFFPRRIIKKYIGGSNFSSVLNASLLGVPMPLCSCGVLPAGIGFYKSGASKGSTVSFMVSTPQTGVDSIIATYAMLGLPLAILRPIIALLSGILGGSLTNYLGGSIAASEQLKKEDENGVRSFREMLRYGFRGDAAGYQQMADYRVPGRCLPGGDHPR